MTNPSGRQLRNFCCLCLTCLLAAAWSHHRKRDEVPRSRVSSSPSAERVLDCLEPICQAIARPGERLKLTAEFQAGGKYPKQWAFWNVECVGEDGRSVAYFYWNAATQQLQRITAAVTAKSLLGHTSLISQQSALVAARRWLRIAGLELAGSHWRFEAPSHAASPTTWTVEAVSHGTHLTFQLNGFTGALMMLGTCEESASHR